MARYCPLFSGSSGNSTYLATAQGGILVDAGVSAKRLQEALETRDIDPRSLCGIFVTHEHTDHIQGLKVFLKRYPVTVYATRGTAQALLEKDALPAQASLCVMEGTVEAAGMKVTSFATSHDSRESCGYRITFPDERVVAVATDMGVMTDTVRQALGGCDLVHIESNHDVRMLENGPYPYMLKRRVLGVGGHLSNDVCASVLPSLLQSGTTRIVLSHLSRENNTPQLALITSQSALTAAGAVRERDYLLAAAAPVGQDAVMFF